MESILEYIKDNVFPGPVDYRKYEYVMVVGDEDEEEDKVAAKIKNIPHFLNPFIWTNAGIYQSYFSVGIALYILSTPVSYYLIDTVDVSSIEYSAYSTLISLPWSLKFVFGIVSDSVSILGYRRKSWMILMWISYTLINFYLASIPGGPSFGQTTAWVFLMVCAYLQADVCHDAMCVERSRHEFEEIKGSFQTGAYSIRSFGSVIGATIGALLYNTSSWGWGLSISQIFVLTGLIPVFTMLPTLWHLEEVQSKKPCPTLYDLAVDIWGTLQLRAVWYPMIFIYSYYMLQVPNSAWTNFLVEGLNFTDFELGILSITGAVLYWFGMYVFKMFFFDVSWRYIYLFTSFVNFVFSMAQILLVLRVNVAWGIPDIYFAVGDNAIVYFIYAVNAMPTNIMFLMLCPEGSEGVTYALLTTIGNLSSTVSYDIGSWLTTFFDVSNTSLEAGDFTGVLWLTILTSVLQLMPLALLWILPDTREEQRKLRDSGETSWWGGFILSSVITISLIVTIFLNIYWIYY